MIEIAKRCSSHQCNEILKNLVYGYLHKSLKFHGEKKYYKHLENGHHTETMMVEFETHPTNRNFMGYV